MPNSSDDAAVSAAVTAADLSHRPLGEWSSREYERISVALHTLADRGVLDSETAADLGERFDRCWRVGLGEGERAQLLGDLREAVLGALDSETAGRVIDRDPGERDLGDRDLETVAGMLAPRMPADRWDATDRENASYYLAVLEAADVYPEKAESLRGQLAEWQDGEQVLSRLRSYAVNARDVAQKRADEQAGGWRAAYETTTYRGPDRYPVPGDWTLGIVEADGIVWRRPPRPDDAARGWTYEDRAGTLNDYDPESGAQTVKFDVNDTPVFTVTDPDRDALMAAIAEVLSRVAAGDDYSDVAPPDSHDGDSNGGDRGAESASLDAFGGNS